MAIYENIDSFYGLKIEQFDQEKGIQNEKLAQRLEVTYEDWEENDLEMKALLDKFSQDPKTGKVTALILGAWEEAYDNEASVYIDLLTQKAEQFSALKALFIGEMTGEENEISWINQGEYSKLLHAYPALEHLQIRGGNGLGFGDADTPVSHDNLKTLIIETGGLGSDVIDAIGHANLPALEKLELWFGDENYGWDGDVSTVTPLLSQSRFPHLKHLGLKNSEIQNDIVTAILNSDLLGQLETIDMSMGVMTDEAAKLLLDNQAQLIGKQLDVSENFLSDEMVTMLEASPLTIKTSEQEEPEEYDGKSWYYVSVSE